MAVNKPIHLLVTTSIVVALGLIVVPLKMRAQDPTPPSKNKVDSPETSKPAEVGQVPAPVDAAQAARLLREVEALLPTPDSLKPQPDVDIPDGPPPHEGAMFDLPFRVRPPSIIAIEVLEALPGRPISGDRLVRPDGTITLGFYGDLHVSGLTTRQIKEKVILRLRRYLSDESLGLTATMGEGDPRSPTKPPANAAPVPVRPEIPAIPGVVPPRPTDAPPKPEASLTTSARTVQRSSRQVRLAGLVPNGELGRPQPTNESPAGTPIEPRRSSPIVQDGNARKLRVDGPVVDEQLLFQASRPGDPGRNVAIEPKDSDRVAVDVSSYNSDVYFVLGDVNAPGRLPCTGRETVLDALQFGGGLCQTADRTNIYIARPVRGKKPARIYPIDLAAIENGDARANLQLFPGDRLFIGRTAVVASNLRIQADVARTNLLLNDALTYSAVMRNFDRLVDPASGQGSVELSVKFNGRTLRFSLDDDAPRREPARRKAALKAWQEFRSRSAKASGPEEKRLRDEMLELLDR